MPQENAGKSRSNAVGPFDWINAGHVVVKAGQAVNWDFSNPAEFLKRVQLIEYGTSAESEFAAILGWLGRCNLVHGLEQEFLTNGSRDEWKIPDLFAAFTNNGKLCSMFIEVKTTKDESLEFKPSYLNSLRAYANLHSLPLLIAWKPRRLGFWLLVDPAHATESNGKLRLSLEIAMKNNLLSVVAGDFLIIPKANTGFFLEADILKRDQVTDEGYIATAQVTKAEFRDANGHSVTKLPGGLMALLFSKMDVSDVVEDDKIRQSFVVKGEPVFAQEVLRTSVAIRTKETELRWRHVGQELNTYLSCTDLNQAVTKNFGTFVKIKLMQHPQVWPSALPASWNEITDN